MKLSRRRFLPTMGFGAVAAKATADQEIAKLAGFTQSNGMGDASTYIPEPAFIGEALKSTGAADIPRVERLLRSASFIKTMGVPKELETMLRHRAKHVHMLDPDIACKQSWSMSVKIMTQRERNYQRELDSILLGGWIEQKRSMLSKLLGFEWPW